MLHDDDISALRAENAALRAALAAAQETIRAQQDVIARLEARVTELEQRPTPPPPWAKAKTPQRAPHERKKRVPEHNKGRRRAEPTRIVEHASERCPDCQ